MTAKGRPKKQPHEIRSARLPAVRLTEAERNDLDLKAIRAGLELSDWVRQQLTAVPAKRPSDVDKVVRELARIGNNVNQIARQLNRGRDADPHHIDHVLHQVMTTIENLDRRYGA